MDHNTCPREDVRKYAEKMVQDRKISRRTLEMIKRWEAAHANVVEGYSLFVGSVASPLSCSKEITTASIPSSFSHFTRRSQRHNLTS